MIEIKETVGRPQKTWVVFEAGLFAYGSRWRSAESTAFTLRRSATRRAFAGARLDDDETARVPIADVRGVALTHTGLGRMDEHHRVSYDRQRTRRRCPGE